MSEYDELEGIAVIGMSGRFPNAPTLEAFWSNLTNGIESISVLSDESLLAAGVSPAMLRRPDYVRSSSSLEDADLFDAPFFGISPHEAEMMDPQHRLFLEYSWAALENAGYNPENYQGEIGVFGGASMSTYMLYQLSPQAGHVGSIQTVLGNDKDYLCTRVSYKLNLTGPSISVQTACSTSLAAICMACDSLLDHQCSMALAGGVTVKVPQRAGYFYEKGSILSPDGHCRAFDAQAGGTVFGDGVGVVVLKRLADAVADGDTIYAVIKGSAVNNDGSVKVGFTAPSVDGQAKVIAMAHAMANVPPDTITYVEAHGTGTPLGDPIEIAALTQAFRAGTTKTGFCAVGSVKTNVGHLESAAGVAGLIKTVLALRNKQLPPSLHFQSPNPEIDFASSPFFVNTELVEWKANGSPRRAGVNSFGMGGTNTHVVLEEAPEPESVENEIDRPRNLLCLSARSEKSLAQLAAQYENFLASNSDTALADICFTASVGRKHFNHRAAIEASSTAEMLERVRGYRAGRETTGVTSGVVPAGSDPSVAFLFTGQGSQYAGMGRELYDTQPVFRDALDRCQEILRPHLKRPLFEVMFADDQTVGALLDETEYTQPALFALEYSLARMWQSWGVEPSVLLGHSVGEYVAACIAGVFEVEDALKLIALRGRLMQGLARDGGMATVFADSGKVRAALASYGSEVSIAALNGPANTVISGRATAVEKLCQELAEKKIRTKALKVSHAFHSSLIEPMLQEFGKEAKKITYSAPRIKLISNLTGDETEMNADYWIRQAREAVRYSDGAKRLASEGIRACLEIGPKPALTRMASESEEVARSGMEMWSSLDGRRTDWEVILETLGRMYAKGVAIDWQGYEEGYERRRVGLPGYQFERQRYWMGTEGNWSQIGGAEVRREPREHELAGWKVKEAWTEDVRYEGELSAENPEYLQDHRVYGEAVVPAAAYLEMMQWATWKGAKSSQSEVEVEGATFRQTMVLKEGERRRVQVVMKPEGDGEFALRVYSEEDAGEGRWALHASGRGRRGVKSGPDEWDSLEEVKARCADEVPIDDLYGMYQGRGLEYGEKFRPIEDLRRGEGEAIALLRLPAGVDTEGYRLHPVMLDGALQVLGGIFSGKEEGAGDTYLPVGLKRLRMFDRPGEVIWVHARIEQGAENTVSAELRLYSEDGRPLGIAAGLESRKASREAVLQNAQEPMENWLYEVDWRPRAVEPATTNDAGSWVVFADQSGLGEDLRGELVAKGADVTLIRSGSEFVEHGPREFSIHPSRVEDFQKAILAIHDRGVRLRGVLNLWSLDAPSGSEAVSGKDVEGSIAGGCHSLLNIVQGLSVAGSGVSPRIWTVTRGAQPVAGVLSAAVISQSSVWGMGRVVSIEHPQYRVTLIDLDPAQDEQEGAALLGEITSDDTESEIGYRAGTRHVARLVRYGQARGGASAENLLNIPQHESYELFAPDSGDLDALEARTLNRRQPGRNEIELDVRALSLNFKDVLNAMKLYPGDAGSLGSECAGIVAAVGAGVSNFAPGDEVIVMGPGSFRKYVTVSANAAVRKPANLSFEAAATIPVAFLTAYYGLHHLAGLKRGENVLIHAATGGVGMAAIQIARLAGAEIYATASPAKWDTLKALGVTRIYNSRTLEFGDQILQATGGKGVDVILNSLSGEAIDESFKVLNERGRFIEIGKRGIWTPEKVAEVKPEVKYFSGDLGEGLARDAETMHRLLEEVVAMFERGVLTELPLTIFPVEQAKDAFRLMQQAKHIGKIAMTVPAISSGQVEFDGAASYLITGGLGGLGLVVARWMVQRGARHLMLVSRRGVRDEAAIKELTESGAAVRTLAANLADGNEVARVISTINTEMPPLKGIIHAAGSLDDGVVQKQSWERFVSVLGSKAVSAWHLHEQTLDRPLDFFVEFSSVASLLGNAGQSNYAAANSFLDGLAYYRRSIGLPSLSINWGGWSEVGMAARQMEGWVSNEMIAPRQGTQILEQLMSQSKPQIGVIPFHWVNFLQQFPIDGEPRFLADMASEVRQQREGNLQGSLLRQQVREADPDSRLGLLLEYLQSLVAKLLRLDESHKPEPGHSLSELGLDSLMGIQLKNRLRSELEVDVPIEEFIESPTIQQLAVLLLELLAEANAGGENASYQAALVPVPRNGALPLSFAQQRLWYLEQLETEFPFYNLSFGFQMKGKPDIGVIERAFNEIISRHETLRTTFAVVDGEPVQRIADQLRLELKYIDYRGVDPAERESRVKAYFAETALYRFDLSKGPLLTAALLQLSDDDFMLPITMHHIATDGWSLGVFTNEFAALYQAFAQGNPSPLPPLKIQYADFAVWQREWLQGEVLERQLSYWKGKLGGTTPVIDLPTDRPRPLVQTFKGNAEWFSCPPELSEKLNAMARQEGATLYIVLLAAFNALIYRYTGQTDILFGSLVANRTRPEVEPLIGFFANMLALRSDVTGNPTFRELVARVKDVAAGAFAHQDLPFEKLVAELQPERNLNRNPLVQVVFVLQQSAFLPALELPGVSVKSLWNLNDGAVRFDLEVHLWEIGGALSGSFIYNADLFDAATIARMSGHFSTLLDDVTTNPDRRIADLQYLSAAEREQLIGMSGDADAAVAAATLNTEGLTDDEVSALLTELLADENEQ